MQPKQLPAEDASHLAELAEEYGLRVHFTPKYGAFDLTNGNGKCDIVTRICLRKVDDRWMWTVYPMGPRPEPGDRHATGYAGTFSYALEDAEAMLRHYLRSTPIDEVEASWPGALDLVGKRAEREMARLVVEKRSGTVCADASDD